MENPRSDAATPGRPHQHHHRASPLDGPARRPHSRPASRPRPRTGNARGPRPWRRTLRATLGAEPRRARALTFRAAVYRLVRRVPRGAVVTYGQVAALLGAPRSA